MKARYNLISLSVESAARRTRERYRPSEKEGPRRVVLLLRNGLPLVFPNLWIEEVVGRNALNTAKAYLEDLVPLYRWADIEGISLQRRMASLTGFTGAEIRSLVTSVTTRLDCSGPVSTSTASRRLLTIRQFIGWMFEFYLDPISSNHVRLYNGEKRRERTLRSLARATRTAPTTVAPNPTAVLGRSDVESISAVIAPDANNNPFRHEAIRLRNFCIFHVALETWARRSELVLLETGDIDLGSTPTITIKYADGRTRGLRNDAASMKTNGRQVPISRELSTLLSTYLDTSRAELLRPRRPSKALFVSGRDGRRLSAKSINHIFVAIRCALGKTSPKPVDLHPHALRKAAANEYRRQQGDRLTPAESAASTDAMRYLAGWSYRSRMPGQYSKEAIAERVNRFVSKGFLK